MMFLDGIEEFTVIPDLRIKKLNLELGSITINTQYSVHANITNEFLEKFADFISRMLTLESLQ